MCDLGTELLSQAFSQVLGGKNREYNFDLIIKYSQMGGKERCGERRQAKPQTGGNQARFHLRSWQVLANLLTGHSTMEIEVFTKLNINIYQGLRKPLI